MRDRESSSGTKVEDQLSHWYCSVRLFCPSSRCFIFLPFVGTVKRERKYEIYCVCNHVVLSGCVVHCEQPVTMFGLL